MSSKLKKVIIVAVVFLVLAIGGLFVVNAITNMSDVIITDFRILDENNEVVQDKDVYLGEASNNKFPINVYVDADGEYGGYTLYSTNKSVANIVKIDNTMYVEYYTAGEARIVAMSNTVATIRDSFKISVHENIAIDIDFVDSVDETGKVINVFADDLDYRYKYLLKGFAEDLTANASSLRVVNNYNDTLFKKVEVDNNTNELVISVNSVISQSGIVGNQSEFITLQSFGVDEHGNEVAVKNFVIKTNIVGNVIEDLQLVVSHTPDFNDQTFVYSVKGTDYIYESENLVDEIYLNNNVSSIYVKARLVFTNDHTMEITERVIIDTITGTGKSLKIVNNSIAMLYNITSNTRFNIKIDSVVSPTGEAYEENFEFVFVNGDLDIDILYQKNGEFYEYVYFDPRFERRDTIIDQNNNIIGFSGKEEV